MKTTIDKAVDLINQGDVVAFPTETVYGLAADAWSRDAVKKVFNLKERPEDNPLIVHIADKDMVEQFAAEIPSEARLLMEHCWPGPLTLIFKKKPEVLDIITAGLDTVALRWPNHPISQELIFRTGPLVAPSANKSGRPSPTKAEHVKEDFGEKFPVIDCGSTQIGLESTVLDVTNEPFTILRPGYIGRQELEQIINHELSVDKPDSSRAARSPGTKYSHYAPEAEVRWLSEDEGSYSDDTLYLLHSDGAEQKSNIVNFNGDFRLMANELYDRFRQADHQDYKSVAIQPFSNGQLENTSIVQALQNRIEKAIGR